uniref:Uncharacterized protein n=1 Tax=Mycena chlorophos TaxID=658473 RepID=A0ABQ0KXI0_MYCCL|nr:predicted protein [Mycena chlorophos]
MDSKARRQSAQPFYSRLPSPPQSPAEHRDTMSTTSTSRSSKHPVSVSRSPSSEVSSASRCTSGQKRKGTPSSATGAPTTKKPRIYPLEEDIIAQQAARIEFLERELSVVRAEAKMRRVSDENELSTMRSCLKHQFERVEEHQNSMRQLVEEKDALIEEKDAAISSARRHSEDVQRRAQAAEDKIKDMEARETRKFDEFRQANAKAKEYYNAKAEHWEKKYHDLKQLSTHIPRPGPSMKRGME